MKGRFGRDTWYEIEGRWIKICRGRKTDSVNVCRRGNRDGDYANRFYFAGQWRTTDADIQRFTKLSDLIAWLSRRSYMQLQ